MSNHSCPKCGSHRLISKGRPRHKKENRRVYACKDCEKRFIVNLEPVVEEEKKEEKVSKIKMIEPSLNFRSEFPGKKGLVVTCSINDTGINKSFFSSLEKYCEDRNFQLLVVPVKYLNPSAMNMQDEVSWPAEVMPYIFRRTIVIDDVLKIVGDCNIQATATHPLTGIDGLSDGMTTIVGHPIVQMKTIPVNDWRDPIILHSTGSVSLKNNYSASKAGYRASYHHSFAAVVVEFDDGIFHIRQLMADKEGGFYDLGQYWNKNGLVRIDRAEALVLGDEHVIFADKKVQDATFFNHDSMTKVLRPKVLVRHDVLDCYSVSSHHTNNFFTRYSKHRGSREKYDIEAELKTTVDTIVKTTPDDCVSMIVDSNHNSHLHRWLNITNDIKNDYVNSKFYHHLMWRVLDNIDNGIRKDAFVTYVEDIYKVDKDVVKFIQDGFEILGIELSMHGDVGPNGARGSISNLSKIGEKSVIGHSHSPGIQAGCWQTGTSSLMRLEYNRGPSSWMHTHCVIYPNGKRQLINIIRGKWRV
jgi:DNA-directed RNA polymerase subunit RPC12/RpoP